MPHPDTNPCATDAALEALARGDPGAAARWASHVDACPACRGRAEALRTRTDPGGLPPTDTFAAGTADDPPPDAADVRAEAARCLRPPEGPDELGWLGPYRVLGVLGAGGMGLVLRADDPALGRHVALKVLRPHLAADPVAHARFRREAQAMAAVEHENIVPVHAVGADRGVPYMAMPLLAGRTLAAAVREEGRLAPARAAALGREVAAGLAAAHARGLVHRDVTPANIWLEPRPDGGERARLLDFGLARAAAGTDLTRTGAVVGTPAFMSPEQARGQPTDHRTDLFSLGAVLYRAVVGEAPFAGGDAFAVTRQVVEVDPPAPDRRVPGLPAGLSPLILRLLRKDPAARPASAQAVADELARVAAAAPTPVRTGRRRWALGGAAAAVLVGVLTWLWPPRPAAGPPDGPPEPAAPLRLVGMVGADRGQTYVQAVALARGADGPVVLSEGFPAGGPGRGVHVWTPGLEPLAVLPTAGDYVRTLAPTPDGRRFVTVGGGGLEVWALTGESARRVVAPSPPPAAIGGIVVGLTGDRVYTTDFEDAGQVRAYELSADALTAAGPLPGVLGLPRQLVVSADGRWVGAAAKSGRVCLWDLRAPGGPLPHVRRTTGRPLAVVAFAPDSRRAWVVDGTAAGEALDLTGDRPTPAGAVPTELAGGPPVEAFADAAGRLVVVGQGTIQVLDVSGPEARPVASLESPSPVRCAAFDPRTGRLYTGHDNGLRLWAVAGR